MDIDAIVADGAGGTFSHAAFTGRNCIHIKS
jgi:hypothetical protein